MRKNVGEPVRQNPKLQGTLADDEDERTLGGDGEQSPR
jgi:hypothetical protein